MWYDFMWILIPFLGREYWLASYASGLAMAMSSVTVVENSILLGRYEPRFATVVSKEKKSTQTSDGQPAAR